MLRQDGDGGLNGLPHIACAMRQQQPAAIRPVAQQAVMLVPAQRKLRALLELGTIGYAKEILRQLDDMEAHNPAYLPFTTELRQLVKQFRLNEYVTRIKEMIRHDLNDVR